MNISPRGQVLFKADVSYGDDECVLVEADGLGGATVLVVEGDYPVDLFTHEEKSFDSEKDAVAAAISFQETFVL